MSISAGEFLKWIKVFHVLTSGSIDTGVVSWNGLTGVVNATADDVLLGIQHLFLTNDGGTTDNLVGMPTINSINASIATKLSLSGGTMTGFLTLNADPILPLQAATKEYVDSLVVSGEYLKIVNNLSDVANAVVSAQNIGASNNYVYITGTTVLTAPLPRRISVSISASGQTLQLPDATTLNTNVVGDIFYIDNFTLYSLSILDGTGSPIFTINPSTRYFYTPDTNGIVAGIWYFWPWIGSINGSTNADNIVNFQSVYNSSAPTSFNISSSGLTINTTSVSSVFNINGDFTISSGSNVLNLSPNTSNNFNSKISITGADANTISSPTIGFFTTSNSYPLLQILPFAHDVVQFNFDCYSYNGNYYSSSTSSNGQIAKTATQLQFNFRSGITPGSSFSFGPGGYFDLTTGNFTLTQKFIMGVPSGSAYALAQFNSTQYGILPPRLNNGFEATLAATLGSVDTGLQWFNTTTLTNNYWTGTGVQQGLTIQNINAGSNITLDKSVPGQVTVNAAGGGTAPTAAFASWSVQNNPITTSVGTSFTPIGVPPDGSNFYNISSSDFTNQVQMVAGIYTIISTYTGATTQYFVIDANVGITNNSATNQTYVINLSVLTASLTLNSTPVQMGILFPTFSLGLASQALPESLSGVVQLNTGDSVLVQISNPGTTSNALVKYINFKVANIAGSIASTTALPQGANNLYLSQNNGSTYQNINGSLIVGNLVEANTTGGQLIDSGVAASSVLTTSSTAGGALSGAYPNPNLSAAGINQVIAITLVTGTSQIMTDSSPINRYILQNSSPCTLTLPTSITAGHSLEIVGGGSAGWMLSQNSGQNILLGTNPTTVGVGGSLSSTNPTDSLILTCTNPNNKLIAYAVQGNITVV